MLHTRLALLVASLSCALLIGGVGTASAQSTSSQPLAKKVPITGKAANGRKFKGTFRIDHFTKHHGKAYAVGTVRGHFKGHRVVRRGVMVPAKLASGAAASQTGSCSILDLTLGPIHLDLLGLVVNTNTIHLTITGQTGPGNLLGNLLCGIANLLNPPALSNTPLGQLVQILNALLALAPSTA